MIPALRRRGEGALLTLGLSAALVALMVCQTIVQTRDGSWVGDFWEHSAVVRELAHHLLHPEQPLLRLDEPHAFFSPYALALAAVTRITGLGPMTVLAAAGVANLLALLAVLPRFVRVFSAEALAPFLTLLFVLFLWGVHPIVYSGFLHFDVLGLVLPYPSTFATALALGAIVVWARHLDQPSAPRVAFVAVAAAVVLLTHPVAAFFLAIMLAALSGERLRRGSARLRALALVAAAAVAAAAAWPYYPFFRLLHEESVFDASNRALYLEMLVQVLPVLVGVPFLLLRLRRSRLDPLVVTAAGVALLYAVGDVTSHWGLGRVLPYGVLVLDVVLADRIAAGLGRGPRAAAGALVFAAVLVALQTKVMAIEKPFVQALPRSVFPSLSDIDRSESVGPAYRRLFAGVPRDAVTMASTRAGWEVPTYGGRIVAALHPQAFVPDLARREADVAAFFDPGTRESVRRRLLCRYGARWILIKREDGGVQPPALAGLGKAVRSAGQYVLLRRTAGCAS